MKTKDPLKVTGYELREKLRDIKDSVTMRLGIYGFPMLICTAIGAGMYKFEASRLTDSPEIVLEFILLGMGIGATVGLGIGLGYAVRYSIDEARERDNRDNDLSRRMEIEARAKMYCAREEI